jgi:hypothetical protein
MPFIDSKIYQVKLDDRRNGLEILEKAGNVLFPLQTIPFLIPTQPPTYCADGHEPGHSAVYSMDVHANVVFHSSSFLGAQLIKLMVTALN